VTDNKVVSVPTSKDPSGGPVFGPEDVVKEELTKEELSSIAQMLAQQTVKVVDSPPFVALIQKIGRMIEAM